MSTKEEIKAFNTDSTDYGFEVPDRVFTEAERKIIAYAMATQAAVVQFINEGILPLDQQIHFMVHLRDFAARIYSGEKLKLPNTNQTLVMNSKAGSLFIDAVDAALNNGSRDYAMLKELGKMSQAATVADDEGDADAEADTNTKRYLN